MEADHATADARRRQVGRQTAHLKGGNVVMFPFVRRTMCNVECGSGWYHAAAIQDEQARPRKT